MTTNTYPNQDQHFYAGIHPQYGQHGLYIGSPRPPLPISSSPSVNPMSGPHFPNYTSIPGHPPAGWNPQEWPSIPPSFVPSQGIHRTFGGGAEESEFIIPLPLRTRVSLALADIVIVGDLAQISIGDIAECEKTLGDRRYIPRENVSIFSRRAPGEMIDGVPFYREDFLDVSASIRAFKHETNVPFSSSAPDYNFNIQARQKFYQTKPGTFISEDVLYAFISWSEEETLRSMNNPVEENDHPDQSLPLQFCKTRDGIYNIIIEEGIDSETSNKRMKFIPFADSETEHLMLWQGVLRYIRKRHR